MTESTQWQKLWESEPYNVEIYNDCTLRVYTDAAKGKIKIEMDGTKWYGNNGGFHIFKFFPAEYKNRILWIISQLEKDEMSEENVLTELQQICMAC